MRKCTCGPEEHARLVSVLAARRLPEHERKEIGRRAAVRAGLTLRLAAVLGKGA